MLGWKARRYRPRHRQNQRLYEDFRYFGSAACLAREAIVNHDFMPGCEDRSLISSFPRGAHGVRFVSKTSAGTGCACHRSRPDADAGGRGRGRRRFGQRFRQGNPRTARTRTRRDDPAARARGQFGRRRRRGDRGDALHHPPAHRRPDRAHQRRAAYRDHVLAGRRQVHPFGPGHRLPGARRQQARRSGQRRRPRSQPQCRPSARIPRPRSAMSST